MLLKLHLRQAEFAQACLRRLLEQPAPHTPRYVGILRHEQYVEVKQILSSAVFKHWDGSPDAPAKRRPRQETGSGDSLSLELLAWHRGQATWPAELLTKFPQGTSEHQKMADLKAKFDAEFPSSAVPSRDADNRAGGGCDYTISGGERPLDLQRVVELQTLAVDAFNEERCPDCSMKFSCQLNTHEMQCICGALQVLVSNTFWASKILFNTLSKFSLHVNVVACSASND